MNLDGVMRNWTNEQWDAAERIEKEAVALLGEDAALATGLVMLVIEEQKRDPTATLEDVLELVILLGVESMFSIRHHVELGKCKTPSVRARVRAVGVPGNRHARAGVSIKDAKVRGV